MKRVGGGLVSACAAAVLAVYLTGYQRTESAARRFAREVAERRVAGMAHRRVRSVDEGIRWKSEASPAAPAAGPAAAPKEVWRDGSYSAWGFSPHGNIEATVRIAGGRIESAVISQCRTRYSCGVIETLPPEVAQRQSADVDYVSGATQSADAFYEAVFAALRKAK
jgi:uncharacterized protein with FMN-binding domain